MTDSNYIPPSERERRLDGWCEACHNTGIGATGDPSDVCRYCPNELGTADILGHMTFMDERDARQRSLIRRLADALNDVVQVSITYTGPGGMENCARLVAEARESEATNE